MLFCVCVFVFFQIELCACWTPVTESVVIQYSEISSFSGPRCEFIRFVHVGDLRRASADPHFTARVGLNLASRLY